MKKRAVLLAPVAGIFIATALLTGCYAELSDQNGSLDLRIEGTQSAGTNEAIVLVVNADYKDSFKEMLWLVDKAQDTGGLSGSEKSRLTEIVGKISTGGLVKFGGFPFFQTYLNPGSGSFQIPGVPAGRDYFVKFFVFQTTVSFKVEDIDEDFGDLIQVENRVFDHNEDYSTADWRTWNILPGQQVTVRSGESVTLNVGSLVPRT
jgi:hypothetical protein